MDLSIIIVNYNVKHFLEQCLISVQNALLGISSEIIVVDNNSVDGSAALLEKKFKNVNLILNKENTGFAVANNQAISISKGKYVLLLNPDTIVQEDTFSKCLSFMNENHNAGALGVKMFDGNGVFLPESKRGLPTPMVAFFKIFGLSTLFPRSQLFGQYHLSYLSKNKIHQVDVLSGAFMLIRKSVIDEVGLLDEAFFMYGEDIDYSYRITKAGYKNYYFPKTNIIHYKGESTKKSSINYVFVFYKAMIIFAEKHFSKKNVKTFSSLINIAIYIRAAIAVFQRLISRWILAILDFIFFTGFIYGLSIFYQKITDIIFPIEKIKILIPIYGLIWTIANQSFGNQLPPLSFKKLIKSNLAGLLFLLTCYALVPKSIQFSRAIILMSSAVVILLSLITRYTFKILNIGLFENLKTKNPRLAIIGSEEEINRLEKIIQKSQKSNKKIYRISPFKSLEKTSDFHGTLSQLNEFIDVNNIKEVIFCTKDVSVQNIIYSMANVNNDKNINFKIVPKESEFIIGSQSIYKDDNYYSTELNHINSLDNVRKKRVFDIYSSFLILLLAPILILFLKGYVYNFKAALKVILGQKTWIGYEENIGNVNLPKIKPCVYSIISTKDKTSEDISNKLNIIYAKDYTLLLDLNLLLKRVFKI